MIDAIEKLASSVQNDTEFNSLIKSEVLTVIEHQSKSYNINAFRIGTDDYNAPTLLLTGGVHGLERIGAKLAWSLLKSTIDRVKWDVALRELFDKVRLVVVPLVNPVGYKYFTRSNGNGVDLMRNAPIDAEVEVPFLLGGHRVSNMLPWYQGEEGVVEKELDALIQLFQHELIHSSRIISIDFHSGFGLKDRLWFPFSYKKEPFDHLAEMMALTELFEDTHPYHVYIIEPQAAGYQLKGDLWDYLYLDYLEKNKSGVYIPLTLEMGSWSWVRKNPLQVLRRHGAFNPIKEHRLKRTFRRHHLLFDFLLKAVKSHTAWTSDEVEWRISQQQVAMNRWY